MMGAMTELATTILDVVALLVVAVGVGLALSPMIGWWSVVVTGCIIFAGARAGEWLSGRRRVGDLP